MEENLIKVGDFVVIQRQAYTKLHRMRDRGNIILGQLTVELEGVVGQKYETVFQMKIKYGSKKCYELEKVTQIASVKDLNIESSGADNRNVADANDSQKLSKEDIEKLRDSSQTTNEIVEQLISNSKTFAAKTEFSQEKYLKKKEKKYFEYIRVRKPTIRILAQMFYRQDPAKMLGIRIDDLSQILAYSNVQEDGNFLLYDSGTSGLLTAALANAIGVNTKGKLIHVHPGNECQKKSFQAMQFPVELQARVAHVNLYRFLRAFYQFRDRKSAVIENKEKVENEEEPAQKKLCSDETTSVTKIPEEITKDEIDSSTKKEDNLLEESNNSQGVKRKHSDGPKNNCYVEIETACKMLEEKLDSIIIASKEHPQNIANEFLNFLKPSGSLVVFNVMKEPLQDLFGYLKGRCEFVNIRLIGNFMRNYQVLDERTHPLVNINFGGYILTAHKIQCK